MITSIFAILFLVATAAPLIKTDDAPGIRDAQVGNWYRRCSSCVEVMCYLVYGPILIVF